MSKQRFTTIRISDINKNWFDLERLSRNNQTIDDAISELRTEFMKGNKKKDYVFHL